MIRQSGFSLVEVMMVLALLALLASLAPRGLSKLYARNQTVSYTHSVVVALRECARAAQEQQRQLSFSSESCSQANTPEQALAFKVVYSAGRIPVFFADGTSNGARLTIQVLGEQKQGSKHHTIIVDRFSSKVTLENNASKT